MSSKYLQDEKQHLLNSIGVEQAWGWSPAIDFTTLLEKRLPSRKQSKVEPKRHDDLTLALNFSNRTDKEAKSKDELEFERLMQGNKVRKPAAQEEEGEAVRILLCGAGDIRHIFKTLSALRLRDTNRKESEEKDSDPTYHFYIYEPNLRVHCRHLFFLQWLLDSSFSLEELEERVLMFLDVFGNAMVRDITAAQVRHVVQGLLKALQSEKGDLISLTSFKEMKLKEKDFIETQLSHWTRDASQANISEQWSTRLRQDLAERFDNRNNIIDWDFVFNLTDYTNLVKFPEYRDWRNTGLAFDVGHINPRRGFEYLYNTPNKTLCHFDRLGRGSYCGDMKNGPFFSLGALTENEKICARTADGTCKYGNGVVALHNCRAWLYTLMTGLTWPWSDHKFAWDDEKYYNYLPSNAPTGTELQVRFPKVRFHFIGLDLQRFLLHVKEGRVPLMDAGFVGTAVTHELQPVFFNCFASHAVIVAETAKFILDAEESGKDIFVQRILEQAKVAAWQHNLHLTAELHKGQPAPKKEEGVVSKAQEVSAVRYAKPHQVALTKGA